MISPALLRVYRQLRDLFKKVGWTPAGGSSNYDNPSLPPVGIEISYNSDMPHLKKAASTIGRLLEENNLIVLPLKPSKGQVHGDHNFIVHIGVDIKR